MHRREVRSFVCRTTKLSPFLESMWNHLWPEFGVSWHKGMAALNFDLIFGRSAGKVLEIGFGEGKSLSWMAQHSKDQDFIGIEVYRKGVARLLTEIQSHQLSNIRILCGDAVQILQEAIPDESIERVQIFFADPWPKTRHHKRRLIQSNFVSLLRKKLRLHGTLHLATDWEDYAHHMMSILSKDPHFRNQAGELQFSERPAYRPITKYEERGIKLGHKSYDLIFQKLK